MLPTSIRNLFRNRERWYHLKGQYSIKQPCVDAALKSMCISVCGVTLWNSFDEEIKQSKNISQFKKKYNK